MSETDPHNPPDDAMVDLLIKQVTEGLSPEEQRALDVLDSEIASRYLRDFEQAAAAISLAGASLTEAPPSALQARLEQEAKAYFASTAAAPTVAGVGAAGNNVLRIDTASRQPVLVRKSRSAAVGWLAAAACLVLAIVGWLRPQQPALAPAAQVNVTVPAVHIPPVHVATPPPTPSEERDAMLARTDSLKVTLGATKDPAGAGVTGDVVWDPLTQRGFLHFAGLASNDPQIQQYQIWIFDGDRDKRYPVDGGVFDVPAGAPDIVIPIRAALAIRDAKAFAVTVEKPGGVVVSGLGHVVALGKAT